MTYTRGGLFFLKTISCPTDRKRALFAQRQEAPTALGNSERSGRFWYKEVIADVMYACIIVHNMIVGKVQESPTGAMMKVDLAPARRPRPTFEDY